MYHPYRQPETANHCLPLNGRCSHICLPAPQFTKRSAKTACFCPDGMRIGKDNLNCETDREFRITNKFILWYEVEYDIRAHENCIFSHCQNDSCASEVF